MQPFLLLVISGHRLKSSAIQPLHPPEGGCREGEGSRSAALVWSQVGQLKASGVRIWLIHPNSWVGPAPTPTAAPRGREKIQSVAVRSHTGYLLDLCVHLLCHHLGF